MTKKGYKLLEGHKQGFQKGNKWATGNKNGRKNKGRKRPDLSEYNKKVKPLQTGKHNGRWKKGYLTEGEKNGRWLGGISFISYPKEFGKELKSLIRRRDNFTCQMCHKSQKQNNKKLDVHHIDYKKKNNDLKNLISLCRRCHALTGFNRKNWRKVFNGRK